MMNTFMKEILDEIMKEKKEKDEENIIYDIIMIYENNYSYLEYLDYCKNIKREYKLTFKNFEYINKLKNYFHPKYEDFNRFG